MWDIPGSDEEDRLQRLRIHLETVQRIADLGSWEADVRTEELSWSPNVHHILGWPEAAEPSYAGLLDAVHPDDRNRVVQAHAGALAGRPIRSFEHRIVRPDGTIRHLHAEVRAEEDGEEPVRLLGVMRDITDRMALTRSLIDTESRRRELLHRLVRASEHERAQLAGDLHDGPIQMLAVAAMRLEHLGMVDPDVPAWLPEAVGTVRETVVQLRDVLVELHPSARAGAGLDATLTQLALTVVPDIDVAVDVRGEVSELESRAVFGIVQEALWDVREGTRTQQLDISVEVGAELVELTMTGEEADSGAGGGLLGRAGLLGVSERTEGVGGRCIADSGNGPPTVHCLLPRIDDRMVAEHG